MLKNSRKDEKAKIAGFDAIHTSSDLHKKNMEYRQLGSHLSGSGLPVSALISAAVDAGINFFDTADLYDKGENEILAGKALRGKRHKVLLATKVGNEWNADGNGWSWNPSPGYILKAVEKSLQRLGTDVIDLYQLHGGMITDPVDDIVQTFEQLKKEGKIRHYGISSIRPNVMREWIKREGLTSVMLQYSLLDRRPEEEMIDMVSGAGKGILARGGLAQGLLSGKEPKDYLEHASSAVALVAATLKKFTSENRTLAQTALRFILSTPGITSAVTGIRTMAQLEEVLGTLDSPQLEEEELKELRSASPALKYKDHR
jgi:aryl-alcohol dehydrogenase-like predicted oxidoreductase